MHSKIRFKNVNTTLKRPFITTILLLVYLISLGQNDLNHLKNPADPLFRSNEGLYQSAVRSENINQRGDTTVQIEKYNYSFGDTLIDLNGKKESVSAIQNIQLQGLLPASILIDTSQTSTTIRIIDKKSINPNDVHVYLDGINSDSESIKKIELSAIGQINVFHKIHQFQMDIGFTADSNIMLVSTIKGLQKCDSILSERFSIYNKFVNSRDLSKVPFTYKGETVSFNELVGNENKIVLKELNNKIVIEIKENN